MSQPPTTRTLPDCWGCGRAAGSFYAPWNCVLCSLCVPTAVAFDLDEDENGDNPRRRVITALVGLACREHFSEGRRTRSVETSYQRRPRVRA